MMRHWVVLAFFVFIFSISSPLYAESRFTGQEAITREAVAVLKLLPPGKYMGHVPGSQKSCEITVYSNRPENSPGISVGIHENFVIEDWGPYAALESVLCHKILKSTFAAPPHLRGDRPYFEVENLCYLEDGGWGLSHRILELALDKNDHILAVTIRGHKIWPFGNYSNSITCVVQD